MKRVLLVNSDSAILEMLRTEIAWDLIGYDTVMCARDGAAAYDMVKNSPFELIISDVEMPGMNGLELLYRITAEKLENSCFVFLTYSESFSYAQQALRYHCREYMVMPMTPAEITETLQRLEAEDFIRPHEAVLQHHDTQDSDEPGRVLYKRELDALISAIDLNDEQETGRCVDVLCECMSGMRRDRSIAKLNLNYLKVRLIHLPENEDSARKPWEGFAELDRMILNGNPGKHRDELKKLALLYADRLAGIRSSISQGVLGDIEKEIHTHYMENLTLKDLADKYYVNSAYLGRLFKKQYDCSFKEYLCSVRIEAAAALLRDTDDDVTLIAERVGYNNTGYFTHKFVELMGCTPVRFRNDIHK